MVVDLQRQIFRNMNILHVKSIKLTHIQCVRRSFWRFLPFYACSSITVIPAKRNSYSLKRVQIFNGFSRNLTPSHTTRDAFMNESLTFSQDVA